MNVDQDALRRWIGHTEESTDIITPWPLAALAATLDRSDLPPRAGDTVPPLWHWLYFLSVYPLAMSGPDGHATRGEFLPPVPLPRRMWAGSRMVFHRPLVVGETVTRTSRIADVTCKTGRSGTLVFVIVRHTIQSGADLVIEEEHDIVYREMPQPGRVAVAVPPAPEAAAWSRDIQPDPVLLFRYSALTFNSHRIHYDRAYAVKTEGYPGLIVHGPLLATLMLDLLRRQRPAATVRTFTFRALAPIFDLAPFAVCGNPDDARAGARLWVRAPDGSLAFDGSATLA